MRIFKLEYYDPDEGKCCQWFASEKAASTPMDDLREKGSEMHLQAVNIPTTKAELVYWLNIYLTRDNG